MKILKFKRKKEGQSLINILIIIVILGIVLGLLGFFLTTKLRTTQALEQRLFLYGLVQEELEAAKIIAQEDWHFIDSKITQTENYHPELSCWVYRKEITISYSNISSTADYLEDFPLLINISSDEELASKAQDNGSDIVFVDNNLNFLDFEIEKFNGSDGSLTAWVKIPYLYKNQDTKIYLYYGNPTQFLDSLSSPQKVWNSRYVLVQHFKETSSPLYDSSIYGNNAQNYGAAYQSFSKINGGYSFDGNDYMDVNNHQSLKNFKKMSIEVWLKTDASSEQMILQKYPNSPPFPGYGLKLKADNGQVAFWSDGIGEWVSSETNVNDGLWHYVVITGSSSGGSIYIDGLKDKDFTYSSPSQNNNSLYIGSLAGSSSFFEGSITELRILNDTPSSDWIKTSYENQADPSNFYTISQESSSYPLFKWVLVSGIEEVSKKNDIYQRWLVFFRVSRDNEGNIEENYSSQRDDPSTRKVIGFAKHMTSGRQVYSEYYLTRWENEIVLQESWRGSWGYEGPLEGFSTTYATSSNISILSDGSLQLEDTQNNGWLLSSIFYSGIPEGIALNSLSWDGSLPEGTNVELKIAASDDSAGPWDDENFYGSSQGCWDIDLGPNQPMEIKGQCRTNFYNKKFFRYKIFLYPDSSHSYTPIVKKVIINYSP